MTGDNESIPAEALDRPGRNAVCGAPARGGARQIKRARRPESPRTVRQKGGPPRSSASSNRWQSRRLSKHALARHRRSRELRALVLDNRSARGEVGSSLQAAAPAAFKGQ